MRPLLNDDEQALGFAYLGGAPAGDGRPGNGQGGGAEADNRIAEAQFPGRTRVSSRACDGIGVQL
jgi:hypothetical protein